MSRGKPLQQDVENIARLKILLEKLKVGEVGNMQGSENNKRMAKVFASSKFGGRR